MSESPRTTENILEQFAAYKGQNVDIGSMEKLATKAALDATLAQRVNIFFLDGNRGTTKLEEAYLTVLLEWYKSKVDLVRVLLLRHVPVCLFLHFHGKSDPLG
jgi:hypothetical protein